MMYFWKIQENIFANEIRNNFSITSSAMNVVTHVHRIKTNRMIDKICDEYIEVDYLVHQISLNSSFRMYEYGTIKIISCTFIKYFNE